MKVFGLKLTKSQLVLLILAVLLSGLMLCGCGKKDNGKNDKTGDTASAVENSETQNEAVSKTTTNAEDKTSKDDADADKAERDADNGDEVTALPLLFDYEWREDYATDLPGYEYLVKSKADLLCLNPDDAKKYPELAKALEKEYEEAREYTNNNYESYDSLIHEAIELGDYIGEMGWFWIQNADVIRSDSRIVSIRTIESSYMGGAHPDSFTITQNYDPQTGKLLKLSDVVTEPDKLKDLINRQLEEKYPDTYFFDKEITLDEYFKKGEGLDWCLSNDGLIVYFSPYEIASYADGTLTCEFPFKEYESLFSSEYMDIPKSSTTAHVLNTPFLADVNNDGRMESISVGEHSTNPEYYENDKLIISVDDKILQDDAWYYSATPVLVNANGKSYLYVMLSEENDYSLIRVYDLSGKNGAAFVQVFYGSFPWICMNEEEYLYSQQIMFDPANFKLNTRMDALSTNTGYRNYRVGNDGVPVSDDKYYMFDDGFEFTVKKTITVNLVDEATDKEGAAVDLNVGDVITLIRTDGEKIVDAQLEDGRMVRLHVTLDDWPQKVEGRDVEMIFDGVVYAG